jgi:hypothetical protein
MKSILAILFAAVALGTHARDLPDPTVTPGATNPAVTQASIKKTICKSGYTEAIRPSDAYTKALKMKQLKSGPYASTEKPSAFEEDHLIPLEVGGHPRDVRNLWPQPRAIAMGAAQKDRMENRIKALVCAGRLQLGEAQNAFRGDWTVAYRKYCGAGC